MTNFRKPPVAEVWIGFDFDPNEKKTEWDLELVKDYVERYTDGLPILEVIQEQQFQVQSTSPTELAKVVGQRLQIKYARIRDEQQSRVLQVGDDQFSYHVVRVDDRYPGYKVVRDETVSKLRDYIEIFQPSRVRNAAIHYVDIIDIPTPPDNKIDVADYFVASADLPEQPFGQIVDLSVQFIINCPRDNGPLVLQLKTLKTPIANKFVRFRQVWHKQCLEVDTLKIDRICSRLDVSHQYIRECFEASLTPKALELFEPIEED